VRDLPGRHLAATLALCASPVSLMAQQATPSLSPTEVDSALTLLRTRALHRDRLDLRRLDSLRRAGIPTAELFRAAFAMLDDVHSSALLDGVTASHWRGVTEAEAARLGPFLHRARAEVGQPHASLLPGRIAYLRVPGYAPNDQAAIDHAGAGLRRAICDLETRQPRGWVLDLRLNTGGNVYPMLSGLGELLGDGVVAWSVDARGQRTMTWQISQGVLHLDAYRASTLAPTCPTIRRSVRIAVLIGPVTMSSGQLTAIALRGDPRVRLFGDSTADGYATSLQWHQVSPRLAINLAEARFADRTGYIHPDVVHPDEVVRGIWRFDDLASDAVVQAAMAWLARVNP